MKRLNIYLFITLCLSVSLSSFAQYDSDGYWPKISTSAGFVSSTLKQSGKPALKSNYGFCYSFGRTSYLTDPIFGMLRVGIDQVYFDATYNDYSIENCNISPKQKYNISQLEACVQVGPSINLNPNSKLFISAYFRYSPTLSYLNSLVCNAIKYASYFNTGGTLSFGIIGIGIEYRFGYTKYKSLFSGINSDDKKNINTTIKGLRAMITLKF